ncbi:MAG: protein-disulfide reductase DsbD [Pseudoxanthomonas sp.]
MRSLNGGMLLLLRMLWLSVLLVPVGAQAQAWLSPPGGQDPPEFLEAEEVLQVQATAADNGRTRLRGEIAPGYYLYRHRLSVTGTDGPLPLALSAGKEKTDEFFGRTEVYYDRVDMAVEGGGAKRAILHWQGCADAGLCYPPQTMQIDLPYVAGTAAASTGTPANPATTLAPTAATRSEAATPQDPGRAAVSSAPARSGLTPAVTALQGHTAPASLTSSQSTAGAAAGEDQQLASRLANASPLASLAVFFGFGLLLAFTPCTLPMIPILSALIVGGQPSPRRALSLSLAYVLPMALTYAALGVAAGLAGANLQASLQHPWLTGAFAGVFVMLAASMLGAFELHLPAWLRNRLQRAGHQQQGGTLAGAAGLGLLSALLVGPCMTAPLAGALLFIGQSGNAITGGLALFALGLGMGIPLLLIAVFGARMLPQPGAWMDRVKAVFGYVMLALAVSMLARVLAPAMVLVLWGAWLLAVAAGLAALAAPAGCSPLRRWLPRYLAVLSAVWALTLMMGGASGARDPWQPLTAPVVGVADAHAALAPGVAYVQVKTAGDVARRITAAGARGQWTLVDFYADWCVSCHVIEREVFGDPGVAQLMAGMQVLRPDVTAHDAADQQLLRAWQVAGPPTLLLIGPDGLERRHERTIGEIDADQFLLRLQRVQGGAL